MAVPMARPERPHGWRLRVGRSFGAVVVTVHGDIDARRASLLDSVLSDLIDGQGNLFVVVDLSDVVMSDLDAVDVLSAARASLEERSGRFVLSAPSVETGRVLDAAGLGDVVEVHPQRRHHPAVAKGPRRSSAVDSSGSLWT